MTMGFKRILGVLSLYLLNVNSLQPVLMIY